MAAWLSFTISRRRKLARQFFPMVPRGNQRCQRPRWRQIRHRQLLDDERRQKGDVPSDKPDERHANQQIQNRIRQKIDPSAKNGNSPICTKSAIAAIPRATQTLRPETARRTPFAMKLLYMISINYTIPLDSMRGLKYLMLHRR